MPDMDLTRGKPRLEEGGLAKTVNTCYRLSDLALIAKVRKHLGTRSFSETVRVLVKAGAPKVMRRKPNDQ
ncbi:MAG TPA: hypothetical protein VM537_24175 [Anaerolineae bacterium]|nr:hypothetical protein [Anaerolineae bacterium]